MLKVSLKKNIKFMMAIKINTPCKKVFTILWKRYVDEKKMEVCELLWIFL